MSDLPLVWFGVGGALLTVVSLGLIWRPARTRWRSREARQAAGAFRLQREQLEAKFFDLAILHGKPRGLRWIDCDWHSDVTYARDVNSGLLTAFVAVSIRFEAIDGGDMEDVDAVHDVRDATAVFHYRRGRWGTGGKTLFNMNPHDAVTRLHGQFEPVAPDVVHFSRV